MLESREILNDGYMSSVVKELNVAVPVEINIIPLNIIITLKTLLHKTFVKVRLIHTALIHGNLITLHKFK